MFGGDPFGNPFGHIRRQMQDMDNMMNSMMGDSMGMFPGFFGPTPNRQLDNGQRHNQQLQQMANQNNMMSPFGFGFGGGLFGGIMQQMESMQNHAMNDPRSTVISQSTMVSFDGNGQPKVVQASTRKAGDVKETRRSVHAGGEEREISVGHSIGDRTHLIEKKRDKDGKMRQKQRFVNLDADEAEQFNNEFKAKASRNLASTFGSVGTSRHAIEGSNKEGRRAVGGTSAPIITVPDDDEEDGEGYPSGHYNGSRRYGRKDRDGDFVHSNNGRGPTIREISEEDDEDVNGTNKRRKVFGKFF